MRVAQLRFLPAACIVVVFAATLACSSSAAEPGNGTTPPLDLSLDAPGSVHSGDVAQLTLRVRNTTRAPLTVISGIPPQEFVIYNSSGEELWSSLATVSCPNTKTISPVGTDDDGCIVINGFRVSAGHEWKFAPREEKTLTGTWDATTSRMAPVEPGDYSLTGLIAVGEGQISTDPVTITVLR